MNLLCAYVYLSCFFLCAVLIHPTLKVLYIFGLAFFSLENEKIRKIMLLQFVVITELCDFNNSKFISL